MKKGETGTRTRREGHAELSAWLLREAAAAAAAADTAADATANGDATGDAGMTEMTGMTGVRDGE